MIFRPLNLIGFLAAATAGLHLYQTKHEVALMDRELRGLANKIEEAQEKTQALHAEWAWLNEPERLRQVAQRHLGLDPMQPAQFARAHEIDRRLPQAVAYTGQTPSFAARPPREPAGPVQLALLPRQDLPVQVARAVPAPAPRPAPVATPAVPAAVIAAPAPLPPRAAEPPVQVATPAPAPVPPMPSIVGPAMAAPLAPASRPPETARLELARAATPKPVVTTAAAQPKPIASAMVAPPKPVVRPAAVAAAAPAVTPARQAPTPAITQVAAASPPPRPAYPVGGSVLGVRGSLPPPVPFGSANAATLESQYGLR